MCDVDVVTIALSFEGCDYTKRELSLENYPQRPLSFEENQKPKPNLKQNKLEAFLPILPTAMRALSLLSSREKPSFRQLPENLNQPGR